MARATVHILLLAALLVLAQIGAAAHALTHLSVSDEDSHHEPVCEWCAVYGHLGAAAPMTLLPHVPAPPHGSPPPRPQHHFATLLLLLAYHSQAPPILS